MKKILLIAFSLILSISNVLAQNIEPKEALDKVARGALLLDVRSVEEFESGHLEQAINIPHSAISQEISKIGSNKDREIVLYCRSGRRADLAIAALKELGFTRTYNAGGYANLSAKTK